MRRTRLVGPQATLWPDWRYHAFVTDRAGSVINLDADHRRHAVCELAIRDLKAGAGLRHCPSGRFLANAAWLVIATLAHNLLRWVATIGLGSTDLLVAKTLRRHLLHLPGRLTRSARQRLLHLPTDWPCAAQFLGALTPPAGSPAARLTPSSRLRRSNRRGSHVGLPGVPPDASSRLPAARAPLQPAPKQPHPPPNYAPTPRPPSQRQLTPPSTLAAVDPGLT